MENTEEPGGILLHVEDDGPLRATETRQGRRGRVQAQASLHSQLVSVCTRRALYHLCYTSVALFVRDLLKWFLPISQQRQSCLAKLLPIAYKLQLDRVTQNWLYKILY